MTSVSDTFDYIVVGAGSAAASWPAAWSKTMGRRCCFWRPGRSTTICYPHAAGAVKIVFGKIAVHQALHFDAPAALEGASRRHHARERRWRGKLGQRHDLRSRLQGRL